MKRFLRKILIFGLIILCTAVILELVAESIPNSYTYKRQYIEDHARDIQTLILGSSYAYDGLSPNELPAAFNLANSSQSLENDYRLLAKYISSMDSLQTVILGVGYATLGDMTETHRRAYYTIYMDLYSRWPLNRYSFEVFNLELLTKKIIKYAVSRDVTLCDSLGQRIGHNAGAVAQNSEFWNKDIDALVANDVIPGLKDEGVNGLMVERNIGFIDSLSSLCASRDVNLVLVNMPVMPEYKSRLPRQQIALHDSVYSSLRSNTNYIDASEWPIPNNAWYNATHLTREASVEFTQRLVNNLFH